MQMDRGARRNDPDPDSSRLFAATAPLDAPYEELLKRLADLESLLARAALRGRRMVEPARAA